jgi:DNA repair protein SbcC/Rad50
MIKILRITDYQSLKLADLTLGRLTVITGPTGSGKSALVRALRLLTFNASGSSYVRRGQASAKVTVVADEGKTGVSITRGKKNEYRLKASGGAVQEYTKLGKGGVPQDIKDALGLSDLNFASQFDRPYLLDSSGGEVARTIGSLTNLNLLLEASREAARRHKETGRFLAVSRTELEGLEKEREQYADLPARQAALHGAEVAFSRAEELGYKSMAIRDRTNDVRQLTYQAELAEKVLKQIAPPSLDKLNEILARRNTLRACLTEFSEANVKGQHAKARADAQELLKVDIEEKLEQVLEDAGICPTCGQAIRSPHHGDSGRRGPE